MGEPSFTVFRQGVGQATVPEFTFDRRVAVGHPLLCTGNGDFPTALPRFNALVAAPADCWVVRQRGSTKDMPILCRCYGRLRRSPSLLQSFTAGTKSSSSVGRPLSQQLASAQRMKPKSQAGSAPGKSSWTDGHLQTRWR